MKLTFRHRAIAAALLLMGLNAGHAAPISWRPGQVHISVESRDLKDVLRDFAASQGIIATIAPNVQGTVSGRFDLPPRKFIDTMAATFGFVWFYDGSVLSISTADDVTTKVIKLDFAGTQSLRSTLKQIGLDTDRFPIVYDPEQGVALITGPHRLIQLVDEVAARLDQNANRRTGSEVRAFPLRYGWAADHTITVNGKTQVVPGVAHVLASLYHPDRDSDQQGTSRASADGTANLQQVSPYADVQGGTNGGSPYNNSGVNPPLPDVFAGVAAAGGGPVGMPGAGGAGGTAGGGSGSGPQSAGRAATAAVPDGAGSLPVIQADARTNSVLIRDLPDRVGQYQQLIDRLDVKRRMVEIEAHIIEIDDGALKQLGVDWHAHSSHVDFQTGSGSANANNFNGNLSPTFSSLDTAGNLVATATPTGGSLTAVIGDASRYLLTRIDALEQNNLARIDASPKVATLDNVEAVMNNKTQFFIPVSGFTSSNLFSVQVGNTLRVLPMVVDSNGAQQIKLQVHVEDGQPTGASVKDIPEIRTSEIDTEAVVAEGQSLLIAGYRIDNDSNLNTGVPVLSKIPVLGALFRSRTHQSSHMERLVLLTPRVIEF
ncbi:type III secretion system outer membrane ring subunit SctC [Paraburkholderia largidicola]|uniref:Type 3 secretion system secretin n=1 Tax=Paraburkholderia largidicola TaxID=3014751 RepID=A0A7I8C098_9BURK|nr:type III secretion system outer membrane ring subunit SctC [Paraburkholderia sp. PGU16]BCF93630.1 EscC/YscC/HrcC family type III secretion system outer membrane ring protein [Paraburkholderia sp. PGU16]